jgi:hypothetical protein
MYEERIGSDYAEGSEFSKQTYAKMFHLAVIKDKQIKILIKYHFPPIILAKIMIRLKASQVLI